MPQKTYARKLRRGEDGRLVAPTFWLELPKHERLAAFTRNQRFSTNKSKTPSGGNRIALSKPQTQMNFTSKTSGASDGLTHIRKKIAVDRYLRGEATLAETERAFLRNPAWVSA